MAIPLVVLGALAAAKAYGSYKSGKQKDKAAKDQAGLNNQQVAEQRLAQQKMLAGIEASGWNPFGVNALGSSSSSQSTSNTSGREDTYTKENPFTTPEYAKLDELVRGVMTDRLSRGSSLPPGYEANAIRRINEASAGGAAAAGNAAARRGLSGQQVFGLNAPIQTARAGQIADLRGNVPLIERQLMNEDIGLEGSRQAQFGTGRESRGNRTYSSRTSGSGSESGSRQVGPDIGALSSLLMPPGAKQSTVSPNSGLGSAFSAIGDAGLAAYSAYTGSGGGGGGGGSMPIPSTKMCPDGAGGFKPGIC